jgi:hypothetical protein
MFAKNEKTLNNMKTTTEKFVETMEIHHSTCRSPKAEGTGQALAEKT